jgi:hypothetical protein
VSRGRYIETQLPSIVPPPPGGPEGGHPIDRQPPDSFELLMLMQSLRAGPAAVAEDGGWETQPELARRLFSMAGAAGYLDDEALGEARRRLREEAARRARRLALLADIDALFAQFDEDGNGQLELGPPPPGYFMPGTEPVTEIPLQFYAFHVRFLS